MSFLDELRREDLRVVANFSKDNLKSQLDTATKKGAKIIGFSGFDGGAMKKMADVCLLVPTTSEVYGTGLVEGFHSVIAHGLIFCLKEQIKNVG